MPGRFAIDEDITKTSPVQQQLVTSQRPTSEQVARVSSDIHESSSEVPTFKVQQIVINPSEEGKVIEFKIAKISLPFLVPQNCIL